MQYRKPDPDISVSSVIVHEGSHLADGEEWVASGFLESKNPSFYKAETDAYTTTGMYQQHQGKKIGDAYMEMKGNNAVYYYVWNKSWKNVDAARALNVRNIVRITNGVTPKNNGGKTLDKNLTQFE